MKPLVVYRSRTGNTATIASAVATALGADQQDADCVAPEQLQGRALVGFGSGIYWGSLDPQIYRLAAALPRHCRVFVFFSSGIGADFMTRWYAARARRRFRKLGLELIGTWNCRGHDRHPLMKWMGIGKGHPDARDLAGAVRFASEIASRP